jgi:hypothetical protein
MSAIEKLKGKQLDHGSVQNPDGSRTDGDQITCSTVQDSTVHTAGRTPAVHPFATSWNEKVKSLSKIREWTKNRNLLATKLLVANTLEEWQEACERVEASDFLSGRTGKWTSCNVDWLLKPANFTKVLEGNYDNRVPTVTSGQKDLTGGWAD